MIKPLRDDLMVQQQVDDPWQHFVGVIMLNQTGRKAVKPHCQNSYIGFPQHWHYYTQKKSLSKA